MEKFKSSDITLEKIQPSKLKAEQALLGSKMVNKDVIDEVSTIITPASFYDLAHIKI